MRTPYRTIKGTHSTGGGPDYSKGTIAYGLKSTVSLNGYASCAPQLCYSEISDDGVVTGIMPVLGWMGSSSCDYVDMKFLAKVPGCKPKWDSVSCRISNNSSVNNKFYFYKHKTNNDCYLINRVYCTRSVGSGSAWRDNDYYYRVGIDFSVPCMSCQGSGSRCITGSSCGGYYCDNNAPGNEYEYMGTSFDAIKTSRGNKPAGLLCTTLESQDHNNYVGAAVFR